MTIDPIVRNAGEPKSVSICRAILELCAGIALVLSILWGASRASLHGAALAIPSTNVLLSLVILSLSFQPKWLPTRFTACVIALSAAAPAISLGSTIFSGTRPNDLASFVTVTAACYAFATLLLATRSRMLAVAPLLGFAGALFSLVALLGYLFGAPLLHGPQSGIDSLVAPLVSLFLGIAIVAAAGPLQFPLKLLVGRRVTATILRVLLPSTFFLILFAEIAAGFLRSASSADGALENALTSLFTSVLITGVVLFLVWQVGLRIDRAERERDHAEAELKRMNDSLESLVTKRTMQLESLNTELRREIELRTQIEKALRASETKNVALLSALPDWIFRLQVDGAILDFRCPRDEHRSAVDARVLPFLSRKVVDWIRRNPLPRESATAEFHLCEDGEQLTYEARFVRSGETELLVVVRDISEVARLEREVSDASLREQRRIGEELHDGVGQQLTAVAFMSRLLELSLQPDNPVAAEKAAEIRRSVVGTISQIRTLSRGLFRYELESDSILPALHDLAENVRKNFQVDCTFDIEGDDINLNDRSANLHLYRISQEAISNAVTHGKATHIQLRLKREASNIIFSIKDDGVGAAPRNGNHSGIGLRTMEFRARRLGGKLAVERHPHRWIIVTCTLPDHVPASPNLEQECKLQNQLNLFP